MLLNFYQTIRRHITAGSNPEKLRLRTSNITIPHSGAVEMHHHPFGRVEGYGVHIMYAVQPMSELRADESSACICSVHVEPHVFSFTCKWPQFIAYGKRI